MLRRIPMTIAEMNAFAFTMPPAQYIALLQEVQNSSTKSGDKYYIPTRMVDGYRLPPYYPEIST